MLYKFIAKGILESYFTDPAASLLVCIFCLNTTKSTGGITMSEELKHLKNSQQKPKLLAAGNTETTETASPEEPAETMADYAEELEASFKQIHEGDILTGTVIGVSESEITLDLKYYTEGIIRLEDFTSDPGFNLKEDVHIGDEISATVIRRDDGEGHILLSSKEANDILAWDKFKNTWKKAPT